MTVVIRGGMLRWQNRPRSVNQSGWMPKMHSSCFTRGNYH